MRLLTLENSDRRAASSASLVGLDSGVCSLLTHAMISLQQKVIVAVNIFLKIQTYVVRINGMISSVQVDIELSGEYD